jgi:hypothetical protein
MIKKKQGELAGKGHDIAREALAEYERVLRDPKAAADAGAEISATEKEMRKGFPSPTTSDPRRVKRLG